MRHRKKKNRNKNKIRCNITPESINLNLEDVFCNLGSEYTLLTESKCSMIIDKNETE